ncbi:MAG: ribosome-associated heat shock protein Hsp15 [Endozoicomonas sp. (ex Botrylloides leachii)]|nr:ribosome-associated heat shock protein Hsp15 [Endozoicomonas sp. (ex Botrylloides leachii)]
MHKVSEKIRLDKWLWAARFYKTRNLAKEAINGGKVYLNGRRCKPSKEPQLQDTLRIRIGSDERTIIVISLSDKRQKAELAQKLYRETEQSIALREKTALERKVLPNLIPRPKHRPDKKERRQLITLKSH